MFFQYFSSLWKVSYSFHFIFVYFVSDPKVHRKRNEQTEGQTDRQTHKQTEREKLRPILYTKRRKEKREREDIREGSWTARKV